ncbi:alcohol dehydrogenase catalytic domain-containing protein [Streptomyces sp. LN245]|uniref:alcohol dehydrogenase catalytic domain-containing protein n=1 Tax=Streptomyces sp. LN245 TaxID=3112975 RepID=UPI00371E30F6
MRALAWHGKRDVRVETVPDPRIEKADDVIVRITSSAICGSDLHLYELFGPYLDPGDILGHEPMGVVEYAGSEVHALKPGDRVVIPFNVPCRDCHMCDRGLDSQCETTQVRERGTGASLFGYTKLYGQVPGGQAELMRVPFGNRLPIKVPDGPPDDRYVYLSDVLPTAWQAVEYADIPEGGTVTVLGLGPIGDMATRIARHRGAGLVIGIDPVADRLSRASAHGVTCFDARREGTELTEAVHELTEGRGTDAVIDAVGMEAHGAPFAKVAQWVTTLLPDSVAQPLMERAGVDRLTALHTAIELVRRGDTVSISGVYGGAASPMPLLTMFDKQIQLRMGQANVWRWVEDILPLLTDADPLGVDSFKTHDMPLEGALKAYAMFQAKEDAMVKTLLHP